MTKVIGFRLGFFVNDYIKYCIIILGRLCIVVYLDTFGDGLVEENRLLPSNDQGSINANYNILLILFIYRLV
jgi:hypothetical protein